MDDLDLDAEPTADRPAHRRFLATLLIASTVALAAGLTANIRTQLEANDISRWCTVWSLVERGTYAIDDCPWQAKTQDKVRKPDKLPAPAAEDGALKKLEYAMVPRSRKEGTPTDRYYSSKPPLLPTLIAGLVYPFRRYTGVPLDSAVEQVRRPRETRVDVPGKPGEFTVELKQPDPVKWPAYVFYFKPIIFLLNVIPMWLFLVSYARLLDRFAVGDWAWSLSMVAASLGNLLFVFEQSLNNHTVAAYSAYFALAATIRIFADGPTAGRYLAAGFFAGFAATNEIPAAIFGVLLALVLLVKSPRRLLIAFAPAALVPIAGFLVTQLLAFGQFKPVYEEFGTKAYEYAGSYWKDPLEMDYLNKFPEPWPRYLFHMTIGHHGVFSLSPIFVFALIGGLRAMGGKFKGLTAVAWLTIVLTVALLAFYTWNPKARNYGGSTQGLRWLFWLIPFWLIVLPKGLEAGETRGWFRGLSAVALAFSVFSVGYALRTPWSHPWILDMLEHLGLYPLVR